MRHHLPLEEREVSVKPETMVVGAGIFALPGLVAEELYRENGIFEQFYIGIKGFLDRFGYRFTFIGNAGHYLFQLVLRFLNGFG